MKKLTKILLLVTIILLLASCSKEQSLQSYLVESQDKKGFITVDVPASILKIAQGKEVDIEVTNAIESIKKINLVAMPYEGNEAKYEEEKNKLKSIFSNSKKYKSLFSVKDKRANMKLYYLGDAENIDEVVAFGYSKEAGVGVARLLGDNMNPSKILEAMQHIKVDGDDASLSQLKNIFENSKYGKVKAEEEKSSEVH